LKGMDRRKFIELALSGAAGAFLAACVGQQGQQQEPATTVAPAPLPSGTAISGNIVKNENRTDRNVRYFKPFVPPAPEEWRLEVNGLVTTPLALTFSDIQQLPVAEQVSRMKCVECWSYKARWGGFSLASLMQQVEPKPSGQFVRFTCGDGYWEVLSVEDLTPERVLFAYRMDGEYLADEYGSPLRLIVPWKYGYKGAKCITDLEFVSSLSAGYWSTVGPYTVHGDIQPGFDLPQETGKRVRITEAGKELTY
jgi:DMSO/TMAO reductase YedYZ molybdopterin-dependent catalytic subunit